MVSVIGVRFQQNGKMYYFDADSFTPSMGEFVIVNTARGIDLGEVIMGVHPIDDQQFKLPLQKVIRLANDQDIQHARENRTKETEAFSVCQKKIIEHKLEMKLVSVECVFDNSKILFYFTANGRVDFRALVKDLASVFKTRIELRQIGVRDEARMLGGLGPCGRPICCGTFLSDFQPVSIKMAKEQNLSLNPTKISGVCGRLMCCLKYEEDHYEQTRKRMPRIGREVITPDGSGIVSDLNIVKETVAVRITRGDDSEVKEYPLDQISRPTKGNSVSEGVQNNTAARAEPDGSEHTDEIIINEEDAQMTARDDISSPDPDSPHETITADDSQKPAPEKRKIRSQRPQRDFGKNRANSSGAKFEEVDSSSKRLGQPVKRENPSRNKNEKNDQNSTPRSPVKRPRINNHPAAEIQNDLANNVFQGEKKNATRENAVKPAKKKGGWADAVEQAIRAADVKE